MTKLIIPGRIIFALGIAALGLLCIVYKDFIVGRPPAWPEVFIGITVLAYIAGALLIVSVLAIITNIKIEMAAMIIASLIFLLSALRIIPHFMDNWLAGYKTLALFGGALIVATTGSQFGENIKNKIVFIGTVLLAVFFIASGYAHFEFAAFVENFIPTFIPFHIFWTYFTAICLIAGGVGILIPSTRKWAALFSGIMLTGWFLFLHIPRLIANPTDASDRMGLCESFTLSGIFFALASIFAQMEKSTKK